MLFYNINNRGGGTLATTKKKATSQSELLLDFFQAIEGILDEILGGERDLLIFVTQLDIYRDLAEARYFFVCIYDLLIDHLRKNKVKIQEEKLIVLHSFGAFCKQQLRSEKNQQTLNFYNDFLDKINKFVQNLEKEKNKKISQE